MNVEISLQDGIYDDISVLLTRAVSVEKAGAYLANYLQRKMSEGIVDLYDYTITDMGIDGLKADVTFSFQWNAAHICSMLVYPKRSLAAAFDHAMGVI